MKVYSLRVEQASSVLGHLEPTRAGTSLDLPKIYDQFVARLTETLELCSAEPVRVVAHTFSQLEDAKSALLRPDLKYVCFDSQSVLGVAVGVSRLFDLTTCKQLGITSRPGFNELHTQIDQLKREYGTTFGIIEDDIFTGGTLRGMIEMFHKQGITITEVVSGIAATKAVQTVPVYAASLYNPEELLELIDPRDYIFGARDGGLVVSHMCQKFRVPYDSAFVDLVARASIDPAKVATFTRLMRAANHELHEHLGSLDYPASLFYPDVVLRWAGCGTDTSIKKLLRQNDQLHKMG